MKKIPCTVVHGLWNDFLATLKLSEKMLSTMQKSCEKPVHIIIHTCICGCNKNGFQLL